MLRTLVATLSAGLLLAAPFQAQALTRLQQRGQALAQRMCSTCHAVGTLGDSPHIGAPRFRELGDRLDLSTFARTLRREIGRAHV